MSQYLIYIKLPVYEKEWCEHHFGNPSVFPKASNVNAVIRHFTKERPSGALPEQQQSGELAIEIPDSLSSTTLPLQASKALPLPLTISSPFTSMSH